MRVMGIDIGTTTISVVMIDGETGEAISTRTILHHGFLEGHIPASRIQDPKKLLAFAKGAVEELEAECGVPDSIGLTGQMHGMLYVDENGNAVSPAYIWQDGCGNEKMESGETYAEYMKKAGGAASAGYGLITHFYLQKNGMIPKNAVKMTTISDYIGMQITGRKSPVIAMDMAASWGCFDTGKGDFHREALEAAGVDLSYLPEVTKEHGIMGYTVKGVPVMVSLGDNQASVLGSVKDLCNTVLLNIGTGSQISVGTEKYVECEGSIELRPCVEGTKLLVGCGLCGGRAYAMLEQFFREICQTDESMYGRMDELARGFLGTSQKEKSWNIRTTFSGTRSNPKERGKIENIGIDNFDPGAMVVGMQKGILEELREMYLLMTKKAGVRAVSLVGSGNGIRKNLLLRQLAEEMFGMKMQIPACKEEAAYGAALYSMVAAGLVDDLAQAQSRMKYE